MTASRPAMTAEQARDDREQARDDGERALGDGEQAREVLAAGPPPGHQCPGYAIRWMNPAEKPDLSGANYSLGIDARAAAKVFG